jgi:hypothetical protein
MDPYSTFAYVACGGAGLCLILCGCVNYPHDQPSSPPSSLGSVSPARADLHDNTNAYTSIDSLVSDAAPVRTFLCPVRNGDPGYPSAPEGNPLCN